MARKRKIPVRHHHGIRDPLKQLETREKKLKNVINNPPEQGGGQKVSKKFAEFKKLVDGAKAGKKLPRRLPAGREDLPKSHTKKNAQTSNKMRPIKQLPGEQDRDFLRRVNRMTQESLREAQYEAKYGVRVVRNAKTGEISIQKKPRNEIDELLKQKEKDRLMSKRGNRARKKTPQEETPKMDPKAARELVKQAIRESNEEQRQEKSKPVEYQRDSFKFGEVVYAPPSISTLPRKAAKNETVPRPGKKNNLLLKSLLNKEETAEKTNVSVTKKKTATTKSSGSISKSQLKGKRKELPLGTRNMLEKEREKFVELYRNLKKAKQEKTDNFE